MALVLAERRRAEKFVRAKVNATAAEAAVAGGTRPVSRAKCPVWTIRQPGTDATFDYSVQLPGMMMPAMDQKAITRQLFSPLGPTCQ
jgi:hypothetical protein